MQLMEFVATKCYWIMLYHDLYLPYLGFVIKEVQPRRHSEMGVRFPQECVSQDRSQDMNPNSMGTYGGTKMSSSVFTFGRCSAKWLLPSTQDLQIAMTSSVTFVCIEITSIFPTVLLSTPIL